MPQATTKGEANYPVVEAFVSNAWFGARRGEHRYNAASARLPLQLLSYFLKLLTDYRSVESLT